jgi:cell wall-associated NlpC family hydrolase
MTPTPLPVPGDVLVGNIAAGIAAAKSWLGTPYSWGGCSRSGVDCSCYVRNVLATLGINAPRTTVTQIAWATPVTASAAEPLDLVFFDNTCSNCGPNPTHVGLVLGNGLMIDAGDPVKIEPIFTGYNARYARPPGL